LTADKLESVLEGLLLAVRRGDPSAMRDLLAPDVVWQGLRGDLVCRGRDEVLGVLAHQAGHPPVAHVEIAQNGELVVLGVRGLSLQEVAGIPLHGQLFQVFTFADGKIVRMQDYVHRDDAFRAAGISDPATWD